MSEFEQTEQNRVRRVPGRGHYDYATVFRVIDVAWIGHVAFVDPATHQATVIPMLHARDGDELIFHGAKSSRLMKLLGSGQPVSVSFAAVAGLVLAKSLFHHSMNYRSAVVFGCGSVVESRDSVLSSLKVLSDKLVPELDKREKKRVKVEGRVQKMRRRGFQPRVDDNIAEPVALVDW